MHPVRYRSLGSVHQHWALITKCDKPGAILSQPSSLTDLPCTSVLPTSRFWQTNFETLVSVLGLSLPQARALVASHPKLLYMDAAQLHAVCSQLTPLVRSSAVWQQQLEQAGPEDVFRVLLYTTKELEQLEFVVDMGLQRQEPLCNGRIFDRWVVHSCSRLRWPREWEGACNLYLKHPCSLACPAGKSFLLLWDQHICIKKLSPGNTSCCMLLVCWIADVALSQTFAGWHLCASIPNLSSGRPSGGSRPGQAMLVVPGPAVAARHTGPQQGGRTPCSQGVVGGVAGAAAAASTQEQFSRQRQGSMIV